MLFNNKLKDPKQLDQKHLWIHKAKINHLIRVIIQWQITQQYKIIIRKLLTILQWEHKKWLALNQSKIIHLKKKSNKLIKILMKSKKNNQQIIRRLKFLNKK